MLLIWSSRFLTSSGRFMTSIEHGCCLRFLDGFRPVARSSCCWQAAGFPDNSTWFDWLKLCSLATLASVCLLRVHFPALWSWSCRSPATVFLTFPDIHPRRTHAPCGSGRSSSALFLLAVCMAIWRDDVGRVALVVFVTGFIEFVMALVALMTLFKTVGAIGEAKRLTAYAEAVVATAFVLVVASVTMNAVFWVGLQHPAGRHPDSARLAATRTHLTARLG